jgi:hypothetical protein
VIARTLALRVLIRTTEREQFQALRFIECNPDIVPAPARDHVIAVEPFRGRYRILEDGHERVEVLGHTAVVDHVHRRVLSLSFAAKPDAGILHAACLRRNGRRVLFAGRESAGKTTLALRLVRAGYELEGDENVFIEKDGVTARPRACRVKETSLPLLPDLADTIASAPFYVDDMGVKTFNLDPRTAGSPWRIEKGPVDCVILLQPNHGGYSSIRQLPPIAVAEILVSEMGRRENGAGPPLGAIAELVSKTKGFDLSLGDHATALRCIDRAINS